MCEINYCNTDIMIRSTDNRILNNSILVIYRVILYGLYDIFIGTSDSHTNNLIIFEIILTREIKF